MFTRYSGGDSFRQLRYLVWTKFILSLHCKTITATILSLQDSSGYIYNLLQTGYYPAVFLLHNPHLLKYNLSTLGCKKQVFDQQFSEKLDSADFGKLILHILIDKAVMRQRAAASLIIAG